MDQFSFVMVLLSIIVGLGLTEILIGIARVLQQRRSIQYYWPHGFLSVITFVALLQQWWEIWPLRSQENWSFPVLLLMLGAPVGLFLISHLMFPDDIKGAYFKDLYFEDSSVIFLVATVTVVLATLFRPLSFGQNLLKLDNLSSLILLISFSTLAFSKRRWLHELIIPLILVIVLGDIIAFALNI